MMLAATLKANKPFNQTSGMLRENIYVVRLATVHVYSIQ